LYFLFGCIQQKHLEIKLFFGKMPSSVRSYRPIQIQLKKEAAELAKEETLVVEDRIKKLEKR